MTNKEIEQLARKLVEDDLWPFLLMSLGMSDLDECADILASAIRGAYKRGLSEAAEPTRRERRARAVLDQTYLGRLHVRLGNVELARHFATLAAHIAREVQGE